MRCQLAPEGFQCQRNEGHDHPCDLERIKTVIYAVVEEDHNDSITFYETVVDLFWDKSSAEQDAERRAVEIKTARYPDCIYFVKEYEVK